jgi:hypothetical protein
MTLSPPTPSRMPPMPMTLTDRHGSLFASLALAHISREYPNKLDHVLLGPDDVRGPRALHPVFFGSFDWHSCVHGYWMLARVLRRFARIPEAKSIAAIFDDRLVPELIAREVEYAAHASRGGFERPYGWAWVLMLAAELRAHETADGRRWAAAVAPLAAVFERRFVEFLPKATYPIRVGTHFNGAFAIRLAWEYAMIMKNEPFRALLRDTATRWFRDDAGCQAWEPGGDDFLSSALMEAECMRCVLPAAEFIPWFDRFLPDLANGEPSTLFTPVTVSDRTDGKIAHLDGLNLSRAWCWRSLGISLPRGDARRDILMDAARRHLEASLPHVAGDYSGEHWLATFATLALDDLAP